MLRVEDFVRMLVSWVVSWLALIAADAILPGFKADSVWTLALVAAVTGVVGVFIRPVLVAGAAVIGWLAVRCLLLAYAATHVGGSVRTWMGLSAGMDLLLAFLLLAGLSVSTIIVSLFGPTPEMIATFAWILAASFVVNGLMLLEVASCERDAAA